jgi:hypothetical protein
MTSRSFHILRWLRKPHNILVNWGMAGAVWAAVMLLTMRRPLAREASSLFAQDRFVIGVHRVSWYLHHAWIGKRLRSALPLFDPTTEMPDVVVVELDDWLTGRLSSHHQLALLYVKARQIVTAQTGASQKIHIADFEAIAAPLVNYIAVPDPNAPALPGDPDSTFTLKQARDALSALKVITMPWYVISGTFLGAVREGTFLAHDYDIDIGIHASDFDDATFRAQIAATDDLVLVNASPYINMSAGPDQLWTGSWRPALYRILHASGIGIDVFIHHLDGQKRWHGSGKHRWNNSEFALDDYKISGLPVKGPAQADLYLTENYGDWRTPVKTFNCSTGTPNVEFPRNPLALAEHLRIALSPVPSRDAQIARLILWQEGYLHERAGKMAVTIFPM